MNFKYPKFNRFASVVANLDYYKCVISSEDR